MKYKNIVFYGGSSEITLELIKLYFEETEKIFIFSRKLKTVNDLISKDIYFKNKIITKIKVIECNLSNYEEVLNIVNNNINELSGLIWVAGFTGDPDLEYNDINLIKKNLTINFLNPTILINEFSKKLIPHSNSFICVITSVAGLRGRKTQLFYSPAKAGLITYLSGLRQKLSVKNIHVCTVIPGYINTKPFREGNWKSLGFLITSPKECAYSMKKAIYNKKEIIYINNIWRIVMFLISLIPEKIFKKLNF
tara:strand:+ start:1654 stop:2406 length:753 start_codon:yes stop_codon:yes gene_type:complete